MANFVEEMQAVSEKVEKLKNLLARRDMLVSQLNEIDNEIKTVLGLGAEDYSTAYRGNKAHPNPGTDGYRLTEVMSDKPMHKNDIVAALENKRYHIKPRCVTWYLSRFDCFQKAGRGYWIYVKS